VNSNVTVREDGDMLRAGDEARPEACRRGADGFYNRLCRARGREVSRMVQTERSRRWVVATAAALCLTAASAVTAMAGRAPLAHSNPVNAGSAQTPVTALYALVLGAAAISLAALVALMWPGRGSDEPDFVQEPQPVHWIEKLVAIAVPLLLGAGLITAVVLSADRVQRLRPAGRYALGGRTPRPPAAPAHGAGGFVVPPWLPWTALGILLVAIAAGGLVLVLRRPAAVAERPDRRAAHAAVEAALGALDTGRDARSAVIAAYAAMERALAARGVTRSPAEAPREYLHRTLAGTSGAGHDARTLTGLFEEARFSTHPIPEERRDLALTALRSLRGRLSAAEDGAGKAAGKAAGQAAENGAENG
jgi:Domain of unknown function (DUF4129)